MSFNPVNNASNAPPRPTERTTETEPGQGATTRETANAGQPIQNIIRESSDASRYHTELQQGSRTPLQARDVVVTAHPSQALLLQIDAVAKETEKYVAENLHMFCSTGAIRIVSKFNAASDDMEPIKIETPSLSELKERLKAEARNMDPSFKPDRIWAVNTLVTFLQTRIPAANRTLFAVAVAIDNIPNTSDEDKARYVRSALTRDMLYPGLPTQELVAAAISGR